MQTAIGSDIMMVLDVCLNSTTDVAALRAAMERTHRWALRSLAARTDPKQALFAIVQGGVNLELRRESAALAGRAPLRRLRARRSGGRRHAIRARGHDALCRRALAGGSPALPHGRRHARRSGPRRVGRDRHLRLRAPDAPGVAGDGLHLDGSREGHARRRLRSRTSRWTPRATARRARRSAARTCITSSSAASRSVRGCSRFTTCATITRSWPRCAAAIERGAYAAFARQKLDAIDRHEHSRSSARTRGPPRAHLE